jgi:signal transduction histidine kinase
VKLSRFLKDHSDEILLEWDRFAKEVAPPGSDMALSALRDHAKELLVAIADNIENTQSQKKQSTKSKGQESEKGELGDAASIHGTLRHHGGFELKEVAAEFRALRASVLHLWLPLVKDMTPEFSYDVTRFNEAIDEALSASIITFSDQTAHTRDTFLAVLGHDLRNPLSAISMSGDFLQKVEASESIHKAGSRIVVSSARMSLMINDLLEYARAQLGGHLALKRHVVDMQRICQSVVDEARAAHPGQEFVLKPSGDLIGSFDEARLQQVFGNLLGNAARYSEPGQPISVAVEGQADAIAVKVHNVGPIIPGKSLQSIFDPLVQLAQQTELSESSSHSVGLGLYIAREITEAHGGTIEAASSKSSGTTFTVLLPRKNDEKHKSASTT